MSLESLFEHILSSEHRAEQSRRALREVRADITRCREQMKQAAEELSEGKMKLESKRKEKNSSEREIRDHHTEEVVKIVTSTWRFPHEVQQFSEKSFLLQLLKAHENALERQCSEITNQRNMLLQTFETTKMKATHEEEKFLKEITDFNNEYDITKKREFLMKENVRIEISVLENQADTLKREMKSMEHDSDQLNELQKQKSELIEELFALQRKLKVFEDEENEAIHTTKCLEEEKIKINEKPQNDAECLRLKKELELYKEDDLESVYEALQREIEFLELTLAQKGLQEDE